MGQTKKYWLMKSEPDAYSIDDFKKDGTTLWDGIRNYQARNFMMNEMQVGDEVLFYHSNATPPGVVGLGKVHAPAVPDPTAFDKKSKYFDAKSNRDKPRWFCITLKFVDKFKGMVSLQQIKEEKSLQAMLLVQRGQRLSIQPVTAKDFKKVLQMASKAQEVDP